MTWIPRRKRSASYRQLNSRGAQELLWTVSAIFTPSMVIRFVGLSLNLLYTSDIQILSTKISAYK